MLFRMLPKLICGVVIQSIRFRAMLFRMLPKQWYFHSYFVRCFRAMLFRMLPKPQARNTKAKRVF